MKKRFLILFLLLIFILGVLFGYKYLNYEYSFSIPCLFYKFTGFYCPACGITRCIFAILNGDFIKAFKYNQLIFILIPILLLYFIYKCYLFIWQKKDYINNRYYKILYLFLILSFLVFGILRNIHYFDFIRP